MKFRDRSYARELLDRDDIPFEHIVQNMRELDTINRLLGGHAITVAGLRALLNKSTQTEDSVMHVVEIGSGGGDNLRVLRDYCSEIGISARFTGIDINPHCVSMARSTNGGDNMEYIESDYRLVRFDRRPHIIFSSLFCHHFTGPDLVSMFRWMYDNSRAGFFINDLQRHPLAYYSIRALTRTFSKSYLVKNDAPLSVLRGFHRAELKTLLDEAGIPGWTISWKWAFRFLIVAAHSNQDVSS